MALVPIIYNCGQCPTLQTRRDDAHSYAGIFAIGLLDVFNGCRVGGGNHHLVFMDVVSLYWEKFQRKISSMSHAGMDYRLSAIHSVINVLPQ